jgi:hypothetical protein
VRVRVRVRVSGKVMGKGLGRGSGYGWRVTVWAYGARVWVFGAGICQNRKTDLKSESRVMA